MKMKRIDACGVLTRVMGTEHLSYTCIRDVIAQRFFLKYFICLAVLGLSCRMQDFLLQCTDSGHDAWA